MLSGYLHQHARPVRVGGPEKRNGSNAVTALWADRTRSPDAVPGSGIGPDVEVRWIVALDKVFTNVVAKGSTTASAASDHTVKALVSAVLQLGTRPNAVMPSMPGPPS